MIVVSYDISDDKLRRKFSKFISKFGYRIQYSLFKIDNSPRILNNIALEIKGVFEKKFGQQDSVIIIKIPDTCEAIKFGYARNEDEELIIVG